MNKTGMKIEVVAKIWYTVELSDEDVEKIRQYIKNHEFENRSAEEILGDI